MYRALPSCIYALLIFLVDDTCLFIHVTMSLPSLAGGWANKLRPPGFPSQWDTRKQILPTSSSLFVCIYVCMCLCDARRYKYLHIKTTHKRKSWEERGKMVPTDVYIKNPDDISTVDTNTFNFHDNWQKSEAALIIWIKMYNRIMIKKRET